jgi:hypothetical protein
MIIDGSYKLANISMFVWQYKYFSAMFYCNVFVKRTIAVYNCNSFFRETTRYVFLTHRVSYQISTHLPSV